METKRGLFNFGKKPTPDFRISDDVERAKRNGKPLVSLESALITHGVPWPENLTIARTMEEAVKHNGAFPATIAVQEGQLRVGLSSSQLESLAESRDPHKLSLRDLGAAVARKWSGGTTVSATLFAAERAGIKVLATGGIGGVHRAPAFDISADLLQLRKSPLVVVCSGAKAILALPATFEVLETLGIPVIGYQTDEFPAFYSAQSRLKVPLRAETPQEVAEIARAHWKLTLSTSILVVVPPPTESAMPRERMEALVAQALQQAEAEGVRGSALTPYLLAKVNELSGGESLKANLALLRNNAAVAAQIAAQIPEGLQEWRYI